MGLIVTLLFLVAWKFAGPRLAAWPPEGQGVVALLSIGILGLVARYARSGGRVVFFWEDVGRELLLYAGAGLLAGLATRAATVLWRVEVSPAWPAVGVYWISLFFP